MTSGVCRGANVGVGEGTADGVTLVLAASVGDKIRSGVDVAAGPPAQPPLTIANAASTTDERGTNRSQDLTTSPALTG